MFIKVNWYKKVWVGSKAVYTKDETMIRYLSVTNISAFYFTMVDGEPKIAINSDPGDHRTSNGLYVVDTVDRFAEAVEVPADELRAELLKLSLSED